jgi:hypothetical protein
MCVRICACKRNLRAIRRSDYRCRQGRAPPPPAWNTKVFGVITAEPGRPVLILSRARKTAA